MNVVLFSGGTGTPKLLQGLVQLLKLEDITVVVNTAEDMWLPHGYFSPDIDSVLYTMAGLIDEKVWYGIKEDSFSTHNQLLSIGSDEFLNIGDRDRATHILRGKLLKDGNTLEEATELIASGYGVGINVLPMSNNRVETVIVTPDGELNLQEFLVLNKAMPEVKTVYYRNIERASACKAAVKAVKKADLIIIGPSNPVTSIGPIISLQNIKEVLKDRKEKIIAVSPLVGSSPVSGPADKFMKALNLPSTPEGVARYYKNIISRFIIHITDKPADIEKIGIKTYRTNIIMRSLEDKKKLADFIFSTGEKNA
ncbi:MAG TPA: 2-phospho-L-lactate transferase [Euryarchaeota archaeon]|nr:2-phospho-L-lactate transferase [archaeon BMS3Bbin15]HDL15818.1 2-phospho-L-lactate transferase [Euryarchaeota archaeon]